MTTSELLTIAELANYLGRHRSTIWRWLEAELLPEGMEIGGRRYWSRSGIDEWLRSDSSRAVKAEV